MGKTRWTVDKLEKVYEYIRREIEGQIGEKEAINLASVEVDGSETSIEYQFRAFKAMLLGTVFEQTINTDNIKLYFRILETDYDATCIKNALTSTKLHLIKKGEWGKMGIKERAVRDCAEKNKIDIELIAVA